jgi:hypothetical protein
LELAAFSLLQALDAKIHALHDERSKEDVAPYENLEQLVEEFLIAAASASEAPLRKHDVYFARSSSVKASEFGC